MRRPFSILSLLSILSLSGCVSTSPSVWQYNPDNLTQVKYDIYVCKAQADQVAWQHIAYGGAVMPLIGLGARSQAYNSCMAARGYVKQ